MAVRATDDFAAWYRAEHPKVLGSLTVLCGDREVASEVADEAFARALAHWRRVSAMASPGGWTYRVALNQLRRRHRRRTAEQVALTRSGPETATVEHSLPDAELWVAVRALPERQRQAVVLRYVADLPEIEIAEALSVSRGAVASNLSAARRRLAEQLRRPELAEEPGEVGEPAETREVTP